MELTYQPRAEPSSSLPQVERAAHGVKAVIRVPPLQPPPRPAPFKTTAALHAGAPVVAEVVAAADEGDVLSDRVRCQRAGDAGGHDAHRVERLVRPGAVA